MINVERMAEQLALEEGFEAKPYRCSEKKLTILHGYNIDARGLVPLSRALGRVVTLEELYAVGLSRVDGHHVLVADIVEYQARIRAKFQPFDQLDEVRQRAVLDVVFNMGGTGALGFKSAIANLELALSQQDSRLRQACWDACAFHLMDSLWADQVDDGLRGRYGRADRVCGMVRTGKDWTR